MLNCFYFIVTWVKLDGYEKKILNPRSIYILLFSYHTQGPTIFKFKTKFILYLSKFKNCLFKLKLHYYGIILRVYSTFLFLTMRSSFEVYAFQFSFNVIGLSAVACTTVQVHTNVNAWQLDLVRTSWSMRWPIYRDPEMQSQLL